MRCPWFFPANRQAGGAFSINFMRLYYDIYSLLALPEVQSYIGAPAYEVRKTQRFRNGGELVGAKNPAFFPEDPDEGSQFARKY